MTGKIDKILRDNLLIIKRYTSKTAHTVAASAAYSWSAGSSYMAYEEPDGYTAVGIAYIHVNNQYLGLSYFTVNSSNNNGIAARNGSTSSAGSVKPVIDIVYAPTELVEVAAAGTDTTRKMFKKLQFTYGYTLGNTSTAKITPEKLGFYIPDGYQIFSVAGAGSGSNQVFVITFDPFNTDHILQLRNASGGSVTSTASITVTFIRSDYAEQILASA